MKEYIIEWEWDEPDWEEPNCMQGLFKDLNDAIDTLKKKVNMDCVVSYVIYENTAQGLDEVYDSRKN